MQTIVGQKQINSSKQIGFMPSYWSIINDDRQLEHIRVQETEV